MTAINKTLSLYGSFSCFSDKTAKDELKLLDSSNVLKFLVEKRSLKDNLKFKLAHIEGRNPKIKDKKIYDLLITRLGKKKKKKFGGTHRNNNNKSTIKFSYSRRSKSSTY